MNTVKLSDTQLCVLESILEDHMCYVEFKKPENDGTKHNLEYLKELMKQLSKVE